MSRAYPLFVGRLLFQAPRNRDAAVIEYSSDLFVDDPEPKTSPEIEPRKSRQINCLNCVLKSACRDQSLQSEGQRPISKCAHARGIKSFQEVANKSKSTRVLCTFKVGMLCSWSPLCAYPLKVMEQLPVELRQAIIERLDLQTLKALRLASAAWAALGEEYLISNHFQTLPHRPDTNRLKSLSEHPKFSHRIQHISFNHGEVNEYHARHNTYFMLYTREAVERANEMNACWNGFGVIRENKDRYLPSSCDCQILTDIFKRLPNLRSINVTLMENPFEQKHSELLRGLWSMPSTRHLPRVATTERFTDILAAVAANRYTLSIKTISHDRLPFEFFAQKESRFTLLYPIFETITHLNLAIDYSDMPNNLHSTQAFERLAGLLQIASSLQVLQLAFQGRRKIDISPLLSSMSNDRHVFLDLKQITLGGIIASGFGLEDFLVRQKNSLRHVHLGGEGVRGRHAPPNGGVHLSSGSFGGLFERLRREMKLDSLRVQGDLIGQESGEKWILERADDEKNLGEYVLD